VVSLKGTESVRFLRKYEPKHPLEVLDKLLYPNLLRDSNGVVLSENIAWYKSPQKPDENKILTEIEITTKKSRQNLEIAYHDSFGNRWIFLVLSVNQSEYNLRRIQTIYAKLYKRINT
jgi:hypothetical protein